MNKGLHLSLMIGSTKASPVPRAVIEALTEVQVTSSASSQSGFQLKFTLGKRSVIAQELLPSGYFDPQRRVIIVAHGNSLRALVKYLDGISDSDIVELNIPTGIPLVYELNKALKPLKSYYLGDAEAAKRAADAVARQAGSSHEVTKDTKN